MRAPPNSFLICAAITIIAIIWYMRLATITNRTWEEADEYQNLETDHDWEDTHQLCSIKEYEQHILTLKEELKEKDYQLEVQEILIHAKDDELKRVNNDVHKMAKQSKDYKNEAKQDKYRLSKAHHIMRDKMLLEEDKLLGPVKIPTSGRNDSNDNNNNKLLPTGRQILLLSAFDDRTPVRNPFTASIIANRQEYCNYHGYTNLFINTTKYRKDNNEHLSSVWFKLPAIKEAFERYPEIEWIWWIENDVLIMNENINLAQHLLNPLVLSERLTYGRPINDLGDNSSSSLYPTRDQVDVNKIDFIFTQDSYGISTGSFFIKRTSFAQLILELWGDQLLINSNFEREEQDAFIYLLTSHNTILSRTGLVPQRIMNAYNGYQLHNSNWKEGDLAINFASLTTENYEKAFTHYWTKRKRVPKRYQIEIPDPPLSKELTLKEQFKEEER